MSKYDFKVGDEIITVAGGPSRTYIIVQYKPGDNWAVVISKSDGWHYALRANTLIPTGARYSFSEALKRELMGSLEYSYNIPKKLLTNEHLTLITS